MLASVFSDFITSAFTPDTEGTWTPTEPSSPGGSMEERRQTQRNKTATLILDLKPIGGFYLAVLSFVLNQEKNGNPDVNRTRELRDNSDLCI